MKGGITKIPRTEPAVAKIDFEFHDLEVWPGAYAVAVVSIGADRQVTGNLEEDAAGREQSTASGESDLSHPVGVRSSDILARHEN